ncbi:uncharacterized protein VP01_4094g1 [Puccinia sorghi]|uniref:Reverse transcriptase Ty1/copia-type domain-containing protein n=1 Tax=Puccinia sorghi TaxID=27349 RepID=A0A0L6US71_9BASI|nr:uncharacterized protein VP01_4094g1 [Puccinia sorghi]
MFPGLKDKYQGEEPCLDPLDGAKENLSTIVQPVSSSEKADQSTQQSPPQEENLNLESPKAPKDISSQISTDNILLVDRRGNSVIVYLVENADDNTPQSYIHTINSSSSSFWKKAIKKEISNMYDHDLWMIVKKSQEQNRLNCTWVFKIKKKQLNLPIEYKARLCVKGFQQIKGTDYGITYAPTGKLLSLCMLIVFVLNKSLKIHQIDIKSAFLNAVELI